MSRRAFAVRLLARTPLRVKLIAAMLALVAIALVVIGVGSVSMLRGYLVDRVDMQVAGLGGEVLRKLNRDALATLRIPPDGLVRVRDARGVTRLELSGFAVEGRPGPAPHEPTGRRFRTVPAVSGDGSWRVGTLVTGTGATVTVAVDMSSVDQITMRLMLIELLGGGAVMAVLAVAGVLIVRRSLRPLTEIEETAAAIAAGRLGARIPDRDPRTEVGRLARSLNGMLAQIESAFQARARSEAEARRSEERMRRFVADASHELRTPLTSIRGFAELALRHPEADRVRLLERIQAQARQMGLLVDDLLLLARLDRQRPLQTRPVDLLALAADAVQDARTLALDRPIDLVMDGAAALIVAGDEVRLRQVLTNLLSNALVHTPEGTPVTVRVGAAGREAFLEVADQGPGLPAEQAARVFERFYRADPSRSRGGSTGGSGLGLAIVAALVRAHGGTVSVRTAPGEGAAFRVTLPLAPEALAEE